MLNLKQSSQYTSTIRHSLLNPHAVSFKPLLHKQNQYCWFSKLNPSAIEFVPALGNLEIPISISNYKLNPCALPFFPLKISGKILADDNMSEKFLLNVNFVEKRTFAESLIINVP